MSIHGARRTAGVRLLLFLAMRSLLRNRVGSAFLLLAILLATGLQIPNAANLAGYTQELLHQGVEQGNGDIIVRPMKGRFIDSWSVVEKKLRDLPWVRAALPKITLGGDVAFAGKVETTPVTAISPDRGDYRLTVSPGEPLRRGDEKGILLGQLLARRIGAKVGDKVRLRALVSLPMPKQLAIIDNSVARLDLFVRGIVSNSFASGYAAIVDRELMVKELGEEDVAAWVSIHTGHPDRARADAKRLEAAIPGIVARAWDEESTFLPNAIGGNRTIELISSLMVLIAVAVPVWALLYIGVQHRRSEIGLLGAIGFSRLDLFLTFLFQGLVIGLVGVALGIGVGVGLVELFTAHPIFEMAGFVIRPLLATETLVRPVGVVLGAVVLASVYPAIVAARLPSATTLRTLE